MKPIGSEKQRQKQRGKKEEQLKNQTEGGGGGGKPFRFAFCKLAQIYSLIVLIEMIKRYYHDGHYSIKVYDCALAVESLR
jgi:hypothetical protein